MTNKDKIIIAILSVAAIGIITAIIVVLVTRSTQPTSDTSQQPDSSQSDPVNVLPSSDLPYPEQSSDYSSTTAENTIINEASNNENIEDFISTCNDQIALAPTPEYRAEMYLTCAGQIDQNYSQDKTDLALAYAYRAEELAPSVLTAQAISTYESEKGNTEKALEYQNIALERMNTPDFRSSMEKLYESGGGV